MLAQEGWQVSNIDAVIAAESPRLAPFIDGIRYNIAQTLGIDVTTVSIKASTNERLGFVGREEGIAAWAITTIRKSDDKGN